VTYAGRRLAQVGLGIRHYRVRFGFVLNVQPDLKLYEGFHPDGDPTWMTSLAREAAGTVRPGAVRTAILEQLVASFGFSTALILDQKQAFSNLVEPHACFFADRR
jgi:lipoate-protein ligase B